MSTKRLLKRLVKRAAGAQFGEIEVSSYAALVAALQARRYALGLSQPEVDAIAGFADRYVSKLEMGIEDRDPFSDRIYLEMGVKRPHRRRRRSVRKTRKALGDMSLPTLLQALGVKLVMVARESAESAP